MAVALKKLDKTDRPEVVFVTPEEYLRREREAETKHEYIAGEILAMAGGKPTHSHISSDVMIALGSQISGGPCEANNSDLMVRVSDVGPFFYPDVTVTCGEPVVDADDCLRNPTLVVEVLSPSTAAYDSGEKFRYYRQIASLRHYVMVAQDERRVEHYARHDSELWTPAVYTKPDDRLVISDLGVDIPLAAIYRRAGLPDD